MIPNARYELPGNGDLLLQRRTFGGVDRTWSASEFNRMLDIALASGRNDFVSVLYLGRFAGLRIHECFRIDTAIAEQALRENAITVKGKGGKVRTVPINESISIELKKLLAITPRGHKLFVPDDQQTHTAIKALQAFIYLYRPFAQDKNSDQPMTFHGLRHTCAAEWYKGFIQKQPNPYQARKSVSKLLGHGRDDVTRIYLASLKKPPQNSSDETTWCFARK